MEAPIRQKGFILISLLLLRKRFCKQSLRPNGLKGFTLIELLVVISIIAILSVIGITVFSSVQKSARDAKRRVDVDALAKAIAIYRSITGSFPPSDCSTSGTGDWSAVFKTAVASYITNIPLDPKNTAGNCLGSNWDNCYCFSPNMWCNAGFSGSSCSSGIGNVWTYLESCSSTSQSGDSPRFGYGCPHFMKSIDPL